MDVRIERGVPIPKSPVGTRGSLQKVLCQMRKGDSIFFAKRDSRSLWAAGLIAFGRGNFTVRTVDGGARIWRL